MSTQLGSVQLGSVQLGSVQLGTVQVGTVQLGTVVVFDEAVGLGTVTDGDGHELPFHCIEIADGTRTIAVGTEVRYGVRPKLGRYEATDLQPVDG